MQLYGFWAFVAISWLNEFCCAAPILINHQLVVSDLTISCFLLATSIFIFNYNACRSVMVLYYLRCILWVFVVCGRGGGGFFFLLFLFLFIRFDSILAACGVYRAVCFITCQTFFIFSALLAFMYEEVSDTHSHTHQYRHNVIFALPAESIS